MRVGRRLPDVALFERAVEPLRHHDLSASLPEIRVRREPEEVIRSAATRTCRAARATGAAQRTRLSRVDGASRLVPRPGATVGSSTPRSTVLIGEQPPEAIVGRRAQRESAAGTLRVAERSPYPQLVHWMRVSPVNSCVESRGGAGREQARVSVPVTRFVPGRRLEPVGRQPVDCEQSAGVAVVGTA